MSNETDYEYFMSRAAMCRHMATIAANPAAAVVHVKLSRLYESAAADLVITASASSRVADTNARLPKLKSIINVR